MIRWHSTVGNEKQTLIYILYLSVQLKYNKGKFKCMLFQLNE